MSFLEREDTAGTYHSRQSTKYGDRIVEMHEHQATDGGVKARAGLCLRHISFDKGHVGQAGRPRSLFGLLDAGYVDFDAQD
jgi:hypothetical protein